MNVATISLLHISDMFNALVEYICIFPQTHNLLKHSNSFKNMLRREFRHLVAPTPHMLSFNHLLRNTVFVPQWLFPRYQPRLCRHFFSNLSLPWLCPKNGHQIKHVLAATLTRYGTQSLSPEGSSTTPSELHNTYLD